MVNVSGPSRDRPIEDVLAFLQVPNVVPPGACSGLRRKMYLVGVEDVQPLRPAPKSGGDDPFPQLLPGLAVPASESAE